MRKPSCQASLIAAMLKQVLIVTAFLFSTICAGAYDPSEFHHSAALGVGLFDPRDDQSAEVRIEYRIGAAYFTPMLGIVFTSHAAVCGYGGLRLDLKLSDESRLTPFGGFGGYRQGNGKDLGGDYVFVGGLEYARKMQNGISIGLTFYHISNAYTRPRNPGAESFTVMFQFPLGTP